MDKAEWVQQMDFNEEALDRIKAHEEATIQLVILIQDRLIKVQK